MKNLKLSDFDYHLPNELIAQVPAKIRDQSRLMVLDRSKGEIVHDVFSNLPQYLVGRPLMVFNDTRVIPAKLLGKRKDTGNPVEVLLIREIKPGQWETLVRGLGRLKTGVELVFANGKLSATLEEKLGGRGLLRLKYSGDLHSILEGFAKMPLPPYIKRTGLDADDLLRLDKERYQTIYASSEGAIAAPTAGLHFTPNMMARLRSGVADLAFLTLKVGVGTFLPIRTEDIIGHAMEEEQFHISEKTWNVLYEAKNLKQKILAVGTTTTRVLETIKLESPTRKDVSGWTGKFIYPGQIFSNVDNLLTNFHLPKSTLYLLVCAFAGKKLIEKAYATAKQKKYRFFSYGDAMLIL